MYALGQKAKDKITGFEGILIGRAEYLTGCDQYGLVAPMRDGKLCPTEWFDEGRIVITGEGITKEEVQATNDGGPNRDAPRS